MKRRAFIGLVGGAAVWPLPLSAQQGVRARRIGVLMGWAESDSVSQARLAEFKKGLAGLGWIEGDNLRIELRWGAGDANRAAAFARELVALKPDVILSATTPVTAALHRETRSIPIVFLVVSDPVGSGFVDSLPRPGGNMTGFINLESSLVEKWLELLKEIAPRVKRVAVMFNPRTAPYAEYYLQPLQVAAPKLRVTTFAAHIRSEAEIEGIVAGLGQQPDTGLIAMTDSFTYTHRKLIVELASRHRVPAMYSASNVPAEGGLISYGIDPTDLFRRAVPYVDRILRGTRPSELPIQLPTKFELVINLKTAKALGLEIPPTLIARADEVIE